MRHGVSRSKLYIDSALLYREVISPYHPGCFWEVSLSIMSGVCCQRLIAWEGSIDCLELCSGVVARAIRAKGPWIRSDWININLPEAELQARTGPWSLSCHWGLLLGPIFSDGLILCFPVRRLNAGGGKRWSEGIINIFPFHLMGQR